MLEMAGVTRAEMAIDGHATGYYSLLIHIVDNVVADACVCGSGDRYYYGSNGWHRLMIVGTGSCDCNCDACVDGEDPAEWAGEAEHQHDFDTIVDNFLAEWSENPANQ